MPMSALELYDEIKDALRYFGLSFYEMNEMKVRLLDGRVEFSHGAKTLTIHITEDHDNDPTSTEG